MSAEPTVSASARPAWCAKTALRADREVAWDRVRQTQANLRNRVGKSGRAATKSRRSLETSNYQRWYRPNDGRYLSPDPIGLAGGEAGYSAYAGDNPLVRSDRSGLMRSDPDRDDDTEEERDTSFDLGRKDPPGTHPTGRSGFPAHQVTVPALPFRAAKGILILLQILSGGSMHCAETFRDVQVSGSTVDDLCTRLAQGHPGSLIHEFDLLCQQQAEMQLGTDGYVIGEWKQGFTFPGAGAHSIVPSCQELPHFISEPAHYALVCEGSRILCN